MDMARFKSGGFCDVCKMAVRYIDGILEQNATEAQIEDAVRKVCNFMPASVRTEVTIIELCTCSTFVLLFVFSSVTIYVLYPQCDQLVEQYEPVLVQLLLQMLDPDFVCMVRPEFW